MPCSWWNGGGARLNIIDRAGVGRPEGDITDEIVVGVIDLKCEGGEEEEGAGFEGRIDTASGLKTMGPQRIERTA